MSSKKISELDPMLSGSLSADDLFVIVDIDSGSQTLVTKKMTNGELSGYLLNTVMAPKANREGDDITVNTLTYESESVMSSTTYTLDFDGPNLKTSTPTSNTLVEFLNPSSGKSMYFKLEPIGSIYTLTLQNGVTVMNFFSSSIPANKAVIISAVCTGTSNDDINVSVSIQQ